VTTRRTFISAAAATAIAVPALTAGANAQAQTPTPPVKQLTLIVPFPAGGATDAAARLIAEHGLRGLYAQNVIVENRGGAGGRLGVEYVKNRPANGTTMLYTPAFPLLIFPHIYNQLSYDSLKDFVPVATTTKGAMGFAVGPAVPASVSTLKEFVAWAKSHPAQSNFGAPSGSSQHFIGATFARAARFDLNLVSYKGGAPAVQDMLGGHISAVVAPLPEITPHAGEGGKVRILAVAMRDRSRFLPDVPTMVELGYKEVVFQDWSGVLAPAGTPANLVTAAHSAIAAYVNSAAGREALAKLGTEPDVLAPDVYAREIKLGWERYRDVVRISGFKAED